MKDRACSVIGGLRAIEFGAPGEMRRRLVDLVINGNKRATAGLLSEYQKLRGCGTWRMDTSSANNVFRYSKALRRSSGRRVFHMTPDEPRQLAIARFVGGRLARWNMPDHSTSRPEYGT